MAKKFGRIVKASVVKWSWAWFLALTFTSFKEHLNDLQIWLILKLGEESKAVFINLTNTWWVPGYVEGIRDTAASKVITIFTLKEFTVQWKGGQWTKKHTSKKCYYISDKWHKRGKKEAGAVIETRKQKPCTVPGTQRLLSGGSFFFLLQIWIIWRWTDKDLKTLSEGLTTLHLCYIL